MLSLLLAGVLGAGGQATPTLIVTKSHLGSKLSLSDGRQLRQTSATIERQRIIDAPGGDFLAVWEERTKTGTRPFYAIMTDERGVARVTETSYTVRLRYAEFDPKRSTPSVGPGLDTPPENDIYIVQFQAQPLQGFRDAVQALGGTIYYYLQDHSYLVRLDPIARQQVAALPFVRWVGPYRPAYKLDPEIGARLQNGTLDQDHYNIQVYEKGIDQKQNVASIINLLGGTPLDVTDQGYVMQAILTPVQLRQVLALNDVFWVDKHSEPEPDMDIVRQTGGANYIETIGNYKGQGVRGQVRDGGVRVTHNDFASRPLIVRTNTTTTSHGTPCTGIIFGDGSANPQGRGMLPMGQGIFIANPGAGFPPSGSTRYNETAALLQAPYFGLFESNSTGNTQVTSYTTQSFTMDDILLNMNLIICQSQSNTGNQNSRPEAWGKNMVSVGGIKHMNTLSKADDNWTGGGSIGPAADGRIKPDLSYFYDSIFSPASTSNTAYGQFSGTSAATPMTAGHFGLLFQMWADGVFGQTIMAESVFDARPHWSTMKAMMINCASQYAFTGTTADLTRTHQGWGLADVGAAYDRRNNMFVVDAVDPLQNLQTRSYSLFVPAGQPAFRATMAYKDLPGTTTSTQHRINDVTLKVTDPTGAVFYYGNNGLLEGNWSTPGGVANTKDTVENVFVQNPVSGVWTVEVQANEVNADAHLQTPEVDVDYALVVTGVVADIVPTDFTTTPASVISGGLAELLTSNNQKMVLRPGLTLGSAGSPGPDLIVTGTSPVGSLSKLRFKCENQVSPRGVRTLSLYDYVAGAYVQVATGNGAVTDSLIEATVTDNPSRFVEPGTMNVRAKIHWDMILLSSSEVPLVSVDQVRWSITP